MSHSDAIVTRIESCWKEVRGEVEGIDLATPVYPDPVWTVRDVLLHCAFWNDEAVKGLAALRDGGEYLTDTGAATFAEGLDAMNQRVIETARAVPEDHVRERWIAAQDALTEAVRTLDGATLAREITCPWHERGTVEGMLGDELAHERGHIADVVTAVSAQGNGA